MRAATGAAQSVETGRAQIMSDDARYLIECADPGQPLNMRVISVHKLATRCMEPAFRLHLRSRGFVEAMVKCMSNPAEDTTLDLHIACLLFILCAEQLSSNVARAILGLWKRG